MSAAQTKAEIEERPILFSGPMVNAILAGRKTQTRRVIRTEPGEDFCDLNGYGNAVFTVDQRRYRNVRNPYGLPGDRLWVRETFCVESNYNIESEAVYPPPFNDGRPVRRVEDAETSFWEQCHYRATDPTPELSCDHDTCEGDEPCTRLWRPSIFMPRWASRITLEITDVRVERLRDITAPDCIAEGVNCVTESGGGWRLGFQKGWDGINAKRPGCSWADNPWVWCIEFKKL